MKCDQSAIEAYLSQISGELVEVVELRELDRSSTGALALKAFNYGRPICVRYQPLGVGDLPGDACRAVVLHQMDYNGYGRERDDDRIAQVWLDYTTFNRLPNHTRARDILALNADGTLESISQARDLLLVSEYVEGQFYAEDLLRIRETGELAPGDQERAATMAEYLAAIHATKGNDPLLWNRRLRDLIGNGEGILGFTDSYPVDYPLITCGQLWEIESAANEWRWRLKPLTHRLSQVHGDFHPFNVIFTAPDQFTLLDRSRGEWGEPADDVSCMTINYVFFSLQRYGKLEGPFAELYTTFWQRYLAHTGDDEMLRVIQPWYAWRALVLASPQWYPSISDTVRQRLFNFARAVLSYRTFDWERTNSYLLGY